ncbi:MAG TPA: hypothetical protein ENF29_01615 [Candidatus Acetothermia bacterium]|nr:hypothetical protein [Candidatus Bipolaricaulota bacterium]RLE39993.1 MAG: hypothetical protein DRJ23_02820 [Candidatus Acetothermia bacterium]HDJ29734.1 hypothetical protein [Candidatus Acetothermia bacterium]
MTGVVILLKSIFVLGLAFAGVVLILIPVGAIPVSSITPFITSGEGEAALLTFGALFLAIGVYLIGSIYRTYGTGGRFLQEGDWGRIELSAGALRELVSIILRQEIGIERFRVQLGHMDGGLEIKVETTLSADQQVAEVSRRIQEVLATRVKERTGVEVGRVSVLVRSIRSAAATSPEEDGDASSG